jgi:2-(3-amino-3-carboxypropyl)histidine synthase
MNTKNLNELEYDLELAKAVKEIKKQRAKRVLIQLPDGLKQYATQIQTELEGELKGKAEFFIWLGSCYGACDIPIETEKLGIDLIIQFGHSDWDYSKRKDIDVLK